MRPVIILTLLSPLLCLLTCNQKEPTLSPPNIDPSLKPYVDAFYEEAQKRNISLPTNIDAILAPEIPSDRPEACGIGQSPSFNGVGDKPTIHIDSDCWDTYNEIAKENLVFHELGHALLNRIHIEGILPNGYSKSIMCAGNGFDCSNLPDYGFCLDYRDYYVDELFQPLTPPPFWSTRIPDNRKIFFEDFTNPSKVDWDAFNSCAVQSQNIRIDSTTQNRPSPYSLRIQSDCGEFFTVRKKIPIEDYPADAVVQLTCSIFSEQVTGPGLRLSMFAESNDVYTSFNRSPSNGFISGNALVKDYQLQVDCIGNNLDTLVVSFLVLEETFGNFLIGDLELAYLE